MPKLMPTDDMEVINIPGPGSFQFSAVQPEQLGATEYTLVTMVVDTTGSVADFRDELLAAVKTIVEACQKSPRAENLMLRFLTFNTQVYEEHGFKPLSQIDVNDYKSLDPQGMTALFDATFSATGATLQYSKSLIEQDFDVNGAIYIITDGADNASSISPKQILENLKQATKDEVIESLITILIGINTQDCGPILDEFHRKAGLTQYVDVGDATAQRLAKLAQWVSKSVSSQSQALGTGSASDQLTF